MGLILRYYDHWLKGEDNGVADERPVNLFVMGENVWRHEDEWPLSRAEEVKYYLHSKGRANTLNGDGWLSPEEASDEPPDVYVYNPIDPVPTRGGQLCCDPAFQASGAYDQRPIEVREDVLVYTTPPMERDTEVTGPVTVSLYASSSARDTDFTAKLVDVEPSGYARNLTDGIIRARYRRPRQPADPIGPGQVYEFTIDLWATSNVFKKGHSIRLEVSSSNFPRFDRNCNTGEPIGSDTGFVSALQTVHHTSQYASHVTLPVVPRE
jgi:putative CocE/NonD family hydrolase